MRIYGICLVLLGLASSIWCSATFVMRYTYFRQLAQPTGDNSAYVIARHSGDALARDLFVPAIVSSISLLVAGLVIFANSRKKKEQERA